MAQPRNRTRTERQENDGWKLGLLAAGGAALVAGLGYYIGSQNREPSRSQCYSYEDNTTTTEGPGHRDNSCARENCSICLRKMNPVRRLNCGHTFHAECISGWLPTNPTCPICRSRQE